MQRRVTVGGAEMKMLVDKGSGIFPFQAGDSGTLPNKKTLPVSCFQIFRGRGNYPKPLFCTLHFET